MPKQEIGRLGEALARDPELRAKLEQAKDVASVIAAAREAGYGFTVDELREAFRSHTAELSEEQLERVAGGSQPQLAVQGLPAFRGHEKWIELQSLSF